ncbi:cytochrome c oxidase subunit II [Acuticoccus sp. MNP-M23]|uniref:cytochrome c oxidase subunit II n=1 Tax=Acuticoccus sp. MNP-M23 TaxID=3072793 RepID=UPI0028165F1F|nr:cytochrome c oxidase subunit II [Acuticoccus sp. MNP-M23]WMS43871.1 cytochrome c oxidase subunit II [Acuticoccus sp. MNP-M23]
MIVISMTMRTVTCLGLACALLAMFAVAPALAQELGQPTPWGVSMQPAASVIMGQIVWFERYTLVIITVITLFVLALIGIVIFRYRAKKNPVASRFTHNTMIEVVWTIVPVLILVAIAFPSFRLLYNQTTIPEPDMTVKIIGAQWYWNYEYQDEDLADIGTIVSYLLDDDARAERMEQYGMTETEVPRLLTVDYPLVVPEGVNVQILTTATDVNHAVAFPVLGVKTDSVVGRINESWFNALTTGVFRGQCSQLCGRLHAYMPLEVHVLTQARFDEWKALAKESLDTANEQLLTWQAEDARGGTPVAMN